jgi:hypothetical protein
MEEDRILGCPFAEEFSPLHFFFPHCMSSQLKKLKTAFKHAQLIVRALWQGYQSQQNIKKHENSQKETITF